MSGNQEAQAAEEALEKFRLAPLRKRIAELEAAIRTHYDQRGDNRCVRDDDDLYRAAGLPVTPETTALPPQEDFLESCARSCRQFWEQRQHPGTKGTVLLPGQMTIAQLTAECERLRAELKARDETDRLTNTLIDRFHEELDAIKDRLTTALADVERLTRERDELRRTNEGLRADVKRLDWIEANAAIDQWNHSVGAVTTVFSRRISPRPIRETIDAVMRGKADG